MIKIIIEYKVLKQDLSLKNIIYKSKYSFRLKNPDELKRN